MTHNDLCMKRGESNQLNSEHEKSKSHVLYTLLWVVPAMLQSCNYPFNHKTIIDPTTVTIIPIIISFTLFLIAVAMILTGLFLIVRGVVELVKLFVDTLSKD